MGRQSLLSFPHARDKQIQQTGEKQGYIEVCCTFKPWCAFRQLENVPCHCFRSVSEQRGRNNKQKVKNGSILASPICCLLDGSLLLYKVKWDMLVFSR